MKSELACGMEFAQAVHELATEHAAENSHRQEEVVPSWNPTGMVRRKTAGWNDTVDVWMKTPTPTIP